mmetsp:Transcript_52923/g.126545  ORF Transcript_52923/g.126545 Transcript_52923/m.126545 type:complete len:80 (+) Transcript_52923:800-1039(+)
MLHAPSASRVLQTARCFGGCLVATSFIVNALTGGFGATSAAPCAWLRLNAVLCDIAPLSIERHYMEIQRPESGGSNYES